MNDFEFSSIDILTLKTAKSQQFSQSRRGYTKSEVDLFVKRVIETLSVNESEIETFLEERGATPSQQSAHILEAAQEVSQKAIGEAKAEAEEILKLARHEAEEIGLEARRAAIQAQAEVKKEIKRLNTLRLSLDSLVEESSKNLSDFFSARQEELSQLNALAQALREEVEEDIVSQE